MPLFVFSPVDIAVQLAAESVIYPFAEYVMLKPVTGKAVNVIVKPEDVIPAYTWATPMPSPMKRIRFFGFFLSAPDAVNVMIISNIKLRLRNFFIMFI